MNLAQRIQSLRKQKGLSQENLAHELGVSRQAVSKWESEQAYPDLDKIILISDYFHVSSDYLLKGTLAENTEPETHKEIPPILEYIATFLFITGFVTTCLLWYHYQTSLCFLPVLFADGAGILLHLIHLSTCESSDKKERNRKFWAINIWPVGFIPSMLAADYAWYLPYPLSYILCPLPVLILFIFFIFLFRKDSSSQ